HDSGFSGQNPAGGSSSTGNRTDSGTAIVSVKADEAIDTIVARRFRGDKATRLTSNPCAGDSRGDPSLLATRVKRRVASGRFAKGMARTTVSRHRGARKAPPHVPRARHARCFPL